MSKITITINAESPEEFHKLLRGLMTAGATSVTINHVNVEGNDPDRIVKDLVEAQPKATNGVNKDKAPPAKKQAAAPKAEPEQPKAEETKQPEPAKEEPKAETKAEPAPAPAPAKKAAAAPKKQVAEEPAGNAPELPDAIKNTNSMRDLLTYLAEHGVDSADAMVATCTVLKKDVPILSKVPNVEERVRRALEVLALFPAPEADAAQA